jgi:predicted MFS family arabinose efflux permease
MFDQLMRRVPLEHGVTFTSVDQSVQNVALVLAPNVGGLIAAAFGARAALLVVALVGAVAFFLFAWSSRPAVVRGSERFPEPEPDQAGAAT